MTIEGNVAILYFQVYIKFEDVKENTLDVLCECICVHSPVQSQSLKESCANTESHLCAMLWVERYIQTNSWVGNIVIMRHMKNILLIKQQYMFMLGDMGSLTALSFERLRPLERYNWEGRPANVIKGSAGLQRKFCKKCSRNKLDLLQFWHKTLMNT